jgi:hypothetical protein
MQNTEFPAGYRRLAFMAVLNMMLKHIPIEMIQKEQDSKIIITQHTFQTRIQLIAAIAAFFKTEEAKRSSFMRYIDSVFCIILRSHVHPLLHAAVLRAISNDLPKTNLNRWRIETYYRYILRNMIDFDVSADTVHKKKKKTSNHYKKMVPFNFT